MGGVVRTGSRTIPRLWRSVVAGSLVLGLTTAVAGTGAAVAAADTARLRSGADTVASAGQTQPTPAPAPSPPKLSSQAPPMTPEQKAAADRHAAEAAARKQAQTTGKPVPVDADTTETTTVSANPDGSFSADERMNPVRVKKNGVWTPIDPTLTADPDGVLRPKAAKLGIAFSGGGTAPLAVIDDGSGHVLTIAWPGPLPKPTVTGASAVYADVLPGVDLEMTAEGTAYSDVLIVHDAQAAANPALKTIHLDMTGPGLTVGTNPNGGLNVVDPSGKTVFTGPTPSLWDSYQSPSVRLRKTATDPAAPAANPATEQPAPPGHTAAMLAHAVKGGIDISPDATVLTSKGTIYPVYIDPAEGLPPEYWAEVWSCPAWAGSTFIGADGSYSISYPGGGTNTDVVRAGYYPGTGCPGPVRPMLEWDIREFADEGATINTAEIWLWQQYGPCTLTDLWAAGPIDGYPSPTWNNIAAGSPGFNTGHFVSQGNCVGGSPNKVVFGDTGQLQSLVSGGSAAHPSMTVGFRTHDESSGNFEAFFVQNNGAYNPVLHVDYNLPPSIDNLWMDSTNGYLPKLPGTSPTYAVHAHVTDADAHPLTVHFSANISDGSTLPAVQAPADASGNATGYIPASWLHDGFTYRLSATVVDNSSNLQASYPDGSRPTFTAAFSPPSQPVITSGTDSTGAAYFPASSTGKPGIKGAGVNVTGAFHLATTLAGATSPRVDYYDYVINGDSSKAGPNTCANPAQCGRLSTTTNDAWINLNSAITHAGINYVYVKAVDLAANTSWYGEYDFFVPAAFVPTTWGDVTGDAVPDIVAAAPADPSAPLGPQRLVAFPTNVDPAKTSSTGFGGNWIETSPATAAPDNTSWAGTLLTHRGTTRGKSYDDLFAWKNGQLYAYLSTLGETSNPGNNPVDAFARSHRAPVLPLPCQKCGANYTGDWSTVKQILALGPVTGGLPSAKTSLIVAEDDGVGGANLWLFTTTTGGQVNPDPTRPPRLIASCSTPIPGQAPCPAGWNWAKTTLIAPGNADGHPAGIDGKATSGLPDLWVRDNTTGTLYMFPNRLANGIEDPTGLGDFSTRVQLGTAGQFKTDQFPALFTNGNADVGGTGKPDLWGLTPNGQLTLIVDPADSKSDAIPAASFETVSSAGWTGSYNLSSADTASLTPAIGALAAAPNGTPVCMDLAGGSTANGAKVQVWTCNGNIDQAWTFGGDGTVRWAGAKDASGDYTKCLEIANSGLAQGTLIQSSDCTGAANQKWRLRRDSSGLAALFNPLSGLCVDDPNSSTANGTQFQTWQCGSGNTAQLWNMPTPGFAPLTAEAENLAVTAAGGGTAGPQTNCCGVTWSGGSQLVLSPSAQNASMTMSWYVPYAGAYRVAPTMTQAVDYGQVQVTVDKGVSGQEQKLPQVFDGYHNGVTTTPFTFGTANFAAPGTHTITFAVTGTNSASTGNRYLAGVDVLKLVPITGLGPIPALTIAPTAFTNFPITADASGTAAGSAAVTSYTFSFDDGSAPVTGPTPTISHTFTTPGTWVLTIKATDANGVSASTSRAIVVSDTASLTSADGTTTAPCATTSAAASTMASLTPTLGATVTAGQSAQFELRDLSDPSTAPPIAFGSAASTGSAGPVSTLSTPALVNGHEYAFAARSSDGSGNVSPVSPTCYFWAITSGGQATPTGAVGLPFDNTTYTAGNTQTWAGPATTLNWSGGNLSLTRNIDSAVLWTSGTWGANNVLVFQNDGNVVIYSAQPTISANGTVLGSALWKTGTSGKGATNLLLATNGSLTVRAGTTVLWTAPTSPRGPSIPNGNFESGTLSGWSASYNAAVTTNSPRTGTYAGQINAPAGGNGSIEQVVTGLIPNTSYTLTGWIRTDGGATILGTEQYNAADDDTGATTTATDWTQLSNQFTTGPTNTTVDIYCYRSTAGTSACDDITLMATPATATVANPDFETGNMAGWNAAYNAGITTTNPHSGTYAGQINAPAGANGSIEQVVTGLTPNTAYTLTGWIRTDGGTTILGTKDYDADPGDDTGATTTSTGWTPLTDQFTTGASSTSVDIYCYRPTAGTSACDDIFLTPTPATVANPDLESGTLAGWAASYGATITTTNPHSGTYAGQLDATTDDNASLEQVVTGLTPNTAYTLTGWIRTDGGTTFLGAKQYDSTTNFTDAATTNTGWTQLTNDFTTGPTSTSVDIYCYRATPGTSACDDTTLTKN